MPEHRESRVTSPFTCLGFPDLMDADTQQRLLADALRGEHLRVHGGEYVRWAPDAGVELWLQLAGRDVLGFNPHFAGKARMRVGLTQLVQRAGETPLDGAFHAWANPPGDDPRAGDFPFIFDAPDAARFASLALPVTTTVQIAAFAHDLAAFVDDAAFQASQPADVRFASESFFPVGLFPAEGETEPGDAAVAVLAGHVLEARRLRNPWSDGEFLWAHVRTLGGEVDVVADPTTVTGDVAVGAIVQGRFWLSGRIAAEPPADSAPFWKRWLAG